MFINEEFKEIVQAKYEEALLNNQDKIILNHESLGELTLYLQKKPLNIIASFIVNEGGDKIYVGSDDLIDSSKE